MLIYLLDRMFGQSLRLGISPSIRWGTSPNRSMAQDAIRRDSQAKGTDETWAENMGNNGG